MIYRSFRSAVPSLICVALVCSGQVASATEVPADVTVTLASGRHFTGQLDPRTDEHELWLRFQRGRAAIFRPVSWAQIVEIRQGSERLTPHQAFQLAAPAIVKTAPPPAPVATLPAPPAEIVVETPTVAKIVANEPEPVHALSVHATAVSWDADSALDGLAISVFPLNGNGEPTIIDGSLEVWLIGELPPGYLGDRNPRLGHWNIPVHDTDFIARGGTFKLPFPGASPVFDFDLGAFAAVHARLTVPGQGSFETTATIRIRPSSGFRDRYLDRRNGASGDWPF